MANNQLRPNEALRYQRSLRGWSQHKVADEIGASNEMISNWERGKKKTSFFYQEKLCALFGMNAEELGFLPSATTDEFSHRTSPQKSEDAEQKTLIPITSMISSANSVFVLPTGFTEVENPIEKVTSLDCATWLGLKLAEMVTLIHQWNGMAIFCNKLQNQLDQEIKALDFSKPSSFVHEEFSIARRTFLIALAALPSTLLSANKQKHKHVFALEEFLPHCAASLTACWHLSSGNHLDSIPPLLDSYLPALITVVEHAPSYREVASDLLAQCYFLKTILAWHIEGLDNAESYCIQALHYSEIAKNTNLRLNALNQHALISYYAKQFPKALAFSEEADSILQHQSHDHIFPIVRGRVLMYLAAIQASNHKEHAEQTLEQAKQAFALQAAVTEPIPLYADCGDAPLTLWDGLTHYHLSFHDIAHAPSALISLRTFGQLHPDTALPERFRLECLNNRILAATQCNEMEEAITCWEMGKQGARTLESKQRNQEADFAYQALLSRWPGETKIQNLTRERR